MSNVPPVNPLSTPYAWELVSLGYEATSMHHLSQFAGDAIRLAAPSRDAHVLDVAAGPGTLATLVAKEVAGVHAVDFSPRMIALLRERVARERLGNVQATVMDGQQLAFPDASFDAAFSMFGLMFFPDRARGFGELARVLRPGGRAVVSSWAPIERSPAMQVVFGALGAAIPETKQGAQQEAPRPVETLESAEVFMREMRRAGFEQVAIHSVVHAFGAGSAAELWDDMVRGTAPIALAREKFGEEEWARRSREAVRFLESRFTTTPVEVRSEAYLAVGTKPRE